MAGTGKLLTRWGYFSLKGGYGAVRKGGGMEESFLSTFFMHKGKSSYQLCGPIMQTFGKEYCQKKKKIII